MKKRIIIFDDDCTRRDSLCTFLNLCDDMACVAVYADAGNAVADVMAAMPDLILMDIDMPGGNGIIGTRKIKKIFPDIPVIIQTVFEDDNNIFEALKAGANGYLLKKTPPDKLLAEIRETFAGGAPMTGSVAIKVLQFFKEEPIRQQYNLTQREQKILTLLVAGHSYKMIAAQCSIAYNTVCNHIANIYNKLHVNSATEAVSLAIRERLV